MLSKGIQPSKLSVRMWLYSILEKNKHESKKLNEGRGTVGKIPVLGMRERVKAKVVENRKAETLGGEISSSINHIG